MKRTIALLLCLIMMLVLAACGGSEVSPDTASARTDTSTETNSGEEENKVQGYDPDMEHMFLAADVTNHSIVLYDLNLCEGDFQLLTDDDVAVVWEWDADEDPNCNGYVSAGIDAAKYRYSEYYGCDVIIACSSSGWAGVIDYERKTVLWEYMIGKNPHSIEMLPNGDVVVACSGNPGELAYIPLSAGETEPVSSISTLWCHGVMWDPQNEWLWVLEDNGVFCAVIENMGSKDGVIKRVNGTGDVFDNEITGGHAFTPVYGEPGKYWVSSASHLWQFDAATETLTRKFNRAATLTPKNNIKGIASFPDGTVIQTVALFGGNTTYDSTSAGFRIVTMEMSTGKVQTLKPVVTEVIFDTSHREFYKVHPFNKNYQ